MLVLKRRTGESITINTPNGEIVIICKQISDSVISLAIKAPDEFIIVRDNAKNKTRVIT